LAREEEENVTRGLAEVYLHHCDQGRVKIVVLRSLGVAGGWGYTQKSTQERIAAHRASTGKVLPGIWKIIASLKYDEYLINNQPQRQSYRAHAAHLVA
jgi:hypothetical protein